MKKAALAIAGFILVAVAALVALVYFSVNRANKKRTERASEFRWKNKGKEDDPDFSDEEMMVVRPDREEKKVSETQNLKSDEKENAVAL